MRKPPQPGDSDDAPAAPLTARPGDTPFDGDIPPDDWELAWPDPDFDRPADLADLSSVELDELPATVYPQPDEVWPVRSFSRDGSGRGTGFAEGGVLDVLSPGVALAGFADNAHANMGKLTDDELIGVLRAWRRQTSWAQARELAAAAELARRRPVRDGLGHRSPDNSSRPQADSPTTERKQSPVQVSEFAADEIAVALTLTSAAAQQEMGLALDLVARAATASALESGQIDLPRVKVILDGLFGLTEEHAAAVEAAVLPIAPAKTTGQLRAAIARAVFAVDPEAALRSRKSAQRTARVEYWIDTAGTGALSGRCLPPAEVLAADQRLGQIAKHWKRQGAIAGMDMLRARIYLALLLGQDVTAPPADLLPPMFGDVDLQGGFGSGDNPRYSASRPVDSGPGRAASGSGHARAGSTPGSGRAGAGPGCAGPAPGSRSAPAGGNSGPGLGRPSAGSGSGSGSDSGPDSSRFGDSRDASSDHRSAADAQPTEGSPDSWQSGGPADSPPSGGPADKRRSGPAAGLPPLAASVNLTVPLATLLGWSQAPGEAGKYGPLDAVTARQLVQATAGHPATRWHLTITDTDGRALAHGCAPRRSPGPGERGRSCWPPSRSLATTATTTMPNLVTGPVHDWPT